MSDQQNVGDYVRALKESRKYGPQVVSHKRIEGRAAQYATSAFSGLHPALVSHLEQLGIANLYTHQDSALQAITAHRHLIVATPTASGKSMVYNLPVLNMLLSDSPGTALYLFPLKALARDQLRVFTSYEHILPDRAGRYAAVFDGDTSPYQRRRIREEGTPVIMTNPEMIHLSLLPYHGNWAEFFRRLRYVVIDEVHTYRGVFGSHMAWILRRLQRVASFYGAAPQFVMLSATIGNPEELGGNLINDDVAVITDSGAPANDKHFILLNPWDSAAYTASQLLEAAVKRNLRTIVYTQARKMTELINLWTAPRLGDKKHVLSAYRAGFLPEERREIEHKLASGELLGVISTSALELGIDIGDLDVCILVGYPGSSMATWQRGGRVGRGGRDSAVILIAQEDALDQYFMRKPETFFRRRVESAVLNPLNSSIMSHQLHCSAAEIPLSAGEKILEDSDVTEQLHLLTATAVLLQSEDGLSWFATRKYPQRLVSLRGEGTQLSIINSNSGEIIGEIDSGRAMKECHVGAVYIHRATTWVVLALEFDAREVIVTEQRPAYFTRPMSNKNTEITQTLHQGMSYRCRISYGDLKVTERVTGYQKRNNSTQKLIGTYSLELPEQIMETKGLWLDIPSSVQEVMEEEKLHFMGAIHALEHGMIATFPLLVLCDRNDIGGISCPLHEQTEQATIFIYDGHAGGVGLAEEGFRRIDELFFKTREMILSCSCENGCPACVHSPKCGSGNRPIDKVACLRLLELVMAEKSDVDDLFNNEGTGLQVSRKRLTTHSESTAKSASSAKHGLAVLPARYGVFDLETKYSAEEVGGWHNADQMGISVAVVYDSVMEGSITYLEHEIVELVNHLMELELVVGFNNRRFDNRVLSGYTDAAIYQRPTLDLLEEVKNHLGYRLSLDRLAEFTLGIRKSGSGLQALEWYKQGRIDLIQKYCRKDVEITRDILLFGLENGYLLFQNKAGKVVRLPIDLERPIHSALSG